MRRLHILATLGCLFTSAMANAQDVGQPGIMYSGSIAAGDGGQLYPFDRQDPWLHGQFQRVPAYGGFARFRPYNYRHVLAQTQISTSVWGSPHGMPYSQQFWNRYRQDYLNGKPHATQLPVEALPQSYPQTSVPQSYGGPQEVLPQSYSAPTAPPQSYTPVNPISYQSGSHEKAVPLRIPAVAAPDNNGRVVSPTPAVDSRPIHIFPAATVRPR